MAGDLDVRIIRSRRRTRTVSARVVDGHILEVRAPAHLSDGELKPIVDDLLRQTQARRARGRRARPAVRADRAPALQQPHFGGSVFYGRPGGPGRAPPPGPGDAVLEERAQALNQRLFGGALRWQSIRFVDNQHSRFGSCTPAAGTIRISRRLAHVPAFVLDYVIVHELAHLREANHSAAFWALVNRYRLAERARGYLMAMQMEDDAPDGQ
jgi:predicted metal-dependent hydrolase